MKYVVKYVDFTVYVMMFIGGLGPLAGFAGDPISHIHPITCALTHTAGHTAGHAARGHGHGPRRAASKA